MRASVLVVAAALLCSQAAAISFTLQGTQKRCVQEDVNDNALILGEYEVTDNDSIETVLEITDSRGNPVYRKEDANKGKFAFTSDSYDVYEICFSSVVHGHLDPMTPTEVTLRIKAGVEAKSYDELAKAEKLKPLELTLRKLEDLAESVSVSFNHLKQREADHRDTNESTAQRLLHFSIFSMLCLIALGTWQIFYLKRYFQKKKLI